MLLLPLIVSLTTKYISLTQLLSINLRAANLNVQVRQTGGKAPVNIYLEAAMSTFLYQEGAESASRNHSGHSPTRLLQRPEDAGSQSPK